MHTAGGGWAKDTFQCFHRASDVKQVFSGHEGVCVCQAGFEKMEVTGRLELPEELLDLERSGILEAAAFDRSRARRGNTTAPSPPLGPQDPLRTTSAQGDYELDDDTSRCVCL